MNLKTIILLLTLTSIFLHCVSPKTSVSNRETFYTKGRFLYSPDGERVILRGVNKMNVVTDKTGTKSFPEIARTGANVVRIMWMRMGGYGAELDVILGNCVKNQLIPMIELHDATGKWQMLDSIVDFWLREDVVQVIRKYEKYLLVNIGNEVGDGKVSQEEFATKYAVIIKKLRTAGIKTPLIIDAANWGRNEQYLLQNGKFLQDQDPEHNVLFSWHVWDSGAPESRIREAIDKSVALEIPLIIGEFAPMEVKCKCCIPYKFILEYCQQKEIGWLAWSWGPGNGDCPAMDMTKSGTFESLHDWGLEVSVTDQFSIKNTSVLPSFWKNNSFQQDSGERNR